jgi:dTDP-4-dehydrorhamnose 3,5-epimerase
MRFSPTALAGVTRIDYERASDERGWFERVYDERPFAEHGLCTAFPQHGRAHNVRRGTLRGLHLQREPHGEAKLIRCVRGAVYDVLVDLRPGAGYGRHAAFELSEDTPVALYVPPGIAHGYQTLADDTELEYLLSTAYVAEAATGVRWNSPALAIAWPLADPIVSARDQELPPFAP